MITETEAKTKWCPNTFGAMAAQNEYGAPIRDAGPYLCVASACMAWRWKYKKGDLIPTLTKIGWTAQNGETSEVTYRVAEEEEGYCGLAGKP